MIGRWRMWRARRRLVKEGGEFYADLVLPIALELRRLNSAYRSARRQAALDRIRDYPRGLR